MIKINSAPLVRVEILISILTKGAYFISSDSCELSKKRFRKFSTESFNFN